MTATVSGPPRLPFDTTTLEALWERIEARLATQERVLIGLTGPPGAGKSTISELLVPAIDAHLPGQVVLVPMDGYHLAQSAVERMGLADVKGSPETFDGEGYLSLLRRLRAADGTTVYAPEFRRDLDDAVAGAIGVPPRARVVVTEGNYLLLPDDPWPQVRAALDEVWSLRLDEQVRTARLVARHVQFGKDPAAAQAWVAAVDEPNARRVVAVQDRADLVVDL